MSDMTTVAQDKSKVQKTHYQPIVKPVLKHLDEPQIDESLHPRVGDRVFWFPAGDIKGTPHLAFVTADSNEQRILQISILFPGQSGMISKDAVRHYASPATVIDRERNGQWAWNRNPKPVSAE